MGLSQNKEDPRVVVVITPDEETAEVDAVLKREKITGEFGRSFERRIGCEI